MRLPFVVLAGLLLVASDVRSAGPVYRIDTIAGNGQAGDLPAGGGQASAVPVDQPFGVEHGPDGALYVTSIGQHRVLRLDHSSGKLTSVAGNGTKGYAGDDGPATQATLNEPYEVRFDRSGNMYFVEMMNHLIRRVDAQTGHISTIAGAPTAGLAGDGGPARAARFKQPHSIALDDRGFLYVADIGNHRIRRIDLNTGQIDSVAGTGEKALPTSGAQAKGQPILGPRALSIAGRTLWIALREGNSVWRLDLDNGLIHHVAGTGKSGYSGDGPVSSATFNGPKGIAAAPDGSILVVDSENQVIRRIDPKNAQVVTIAGLGPQARGFAGDGGASALGAKFDRPHGIGVSPDGSISIGDTNNHRVRRIAKGP